MGDVSLEGSWYPDTDCISMQGAISARNARAISCTVAALVTMGCVALILSSAGDQDIATMELGQEWDPQGPTDSRDYPTPDDDFVDPTAPQFGRVPTDSRAPHDPTALKVPKTDPTAKAVKPKPVVVKEKKVVLVSTKVNQHTKSKAETKAAAKKGVDKLARMQRNLLDLRAFFDVAHDDIEDMEANGSEEFAIIKPLVDELRKAKLEDLVQGWENFAKLMQKRNPLPASLADYMTTFMTKQLETEKGLLSIRRNRHGRWATITGRKVGLEATPYIWHKLMKAKLDTVLRK